MDFKALRGSPGGSGLRRVPVRTLSLEGSEFGGGPTSIRERKECQQRRWALNEGGL